MAVTTKQVNQLLNYPCGPIIKMMVGCWTLMIKGLGVILHRYISPQNGPHQYVDTAELRPEPKNSPPYIDLKWRNHKNINENCHRPITAVHPQIHLPDWSCPQPPRNNQTTVSASELRGSTHIIP